MSISKLKVLYKDPVVLLTLCTMIASTMISSFLVHKNSYKIGTIESEIRDKKMMISDVSYSVNQKRSQIDTLILLDSITDKNDKKMHPIRKKYLQTFPNLNEESSEVEILDEFEKYRGAEFDRINDVYIAQVALEEIKDELGRKNKMYSSLATLLQVIGLALIIVRKDLSIDSILS
jgi:hypothetical protein